MKILTFNIKNDYSFFNKKVKQKLQSVIELIEKENIDIVGTQELTRKKIKYLKKKLQDYYIIGKSRRSLFNSNEYNSIIIKKNLVQLKKDSKTYSLSENIKRRGSKFKGSKFPRICTLLHIEVDNKKYLVINTHLDNSSQDNRDKQIKKLEEIIKLERKDKELLIVMGDFNMTLTSSLLTFKLNYKLRCTENLGNTLIFSTKKRQIDYIFTSHDIKVIEYKKITNKYNDIYASDHYPVFLNIK